MHCVDLGENFPTSIYLQNLASIQPRTSLVKFARSPRTDPPGFLMVLFRLIGSYFDVFVFSISLFDGQYRNASGMICLQAPSPMGGLTRRSTSAVRTLSFFLEDNSYMYWYLDKVWTVRSWRGEVID